MSLYPAPEQSGFYGHVYKEQGEMDLAIEAMHKALELLLNDKDIHFDLAEYYAKTADTVNALKFYASGLEWYMEEEKEDDYFKAEAIVRKGSLISD